MSVQISEHVVNFDQDVANWVTHYRDTLYQIKQLQEQADVARSHIEVALGDCEEGFHNNRLLVRWTNVVTERLDTKRVREILTPEILQQFTSTTTSRRFTLVNEEQE